MPAGESRAIVPEYVPVDGVGEQIAANKRTAKFARKCVPFINNAPGRDVAADLGPVVCDWTVIAVGVRVVQRPMLGKSLEVIAALDHMKGDVGPVAAAEGVTGGVEVEAPRIAATFCEELKLTRARDGSARFPAGIRFRGSWR